MIVQKSAQNVNSNAGVFLAKQLLDRMGGFSRFDGWQKSERSVPCQRYSNSSLVKAQVALMSLGKTSFADIAAHQQDDLFADAIRGDVPSEPTFRQRIGAVAAMPGVRDVVDDLNLDLLRRVEEFGTVRSSASTKWSRRRRTTCFSPTSRSRSGGRTFPTTPTRSSGCTTNTRAAELHLRRRDLRQPRRTTMPAARQELPRGRRLHGDRRKAGGLTS